MVNVGVLMFTYNNVKDPLDSPECLSHSAQKLIFTENNLHCSCDFQWIQLHQDQTLLNENYCDSGEVYKALVYYKPIGCPPMPTIPEPLGQTIELTATTPSELFTVNRQVDYRDGISTANRLILSNFIVWVSVLLSFH